MERSDRLNNFLGRIFLKKEKQNTLQDDTEGVAKNLKKK